MGRLYCREEESMEFKIIGIRADGNAKIGMGHLMRCLSVADALQKKQSKVIFITNNEQSESFLIQKGFFCHRLQGMYTGMDEEAEELCSILRTEKVSLLLADSYQVTEAYLKKIRKVCPVFYMDDLGSMSLPVDGLINYNIYGQDMGYEAFYPADTKLLLGSLYAPVKPEFLKTAYTVRREVRSILITMGGSDTLNIAGKLGERLLEEISPDITLTLICGRFSPHLSKLQGLSKKDKRVRVLTDVADMWNHMSACDLAVAAAGSTMYELCTLGVPTVCCYYVENQRRIAEAFGEKTSMLNAGDFSVEPIQVMERIVCEIQSLSADYSMRVQLSKEMKKMVDGQGAGRIAEALMGI